MHATAVDFGGKLIEIYALLYYTPYFGIFSYICFKIFESYIKISNSIFLCQASYSLNITLLS